MTHGFRTFSEPRQTLWLSEWKALTVYLFGSGSLWVNRVINFVSLRFPISVEE